MGFNDLSVQLHLFSKSLKIPFLGRAIIFINFCFSITSNIDRRGMPVYLLFSNNEIKESHANDTTRTSQFSKCLILRTPSNLSIFSHSFQVIHGKLCSHSVWITIDNIPKISCFGVCFDDNGRKVDSNRYSAPEVLRFQHLCIQSDIWSFGCLIWECCSLGGTLYPEIQSNDLCSRIKEGVRPERIHYIHNDMHQLLINCWQIEPSERPTFSEITSVLWQFLSSPQHILSFQRREGYTLPCYLPLLEIQTA